MSKKLRKLRMRRHPGEPTTIIHPSDETDDETSKTPLPPPPPPTADQAIDLMRIRGIGRVYSDLLNRVGVKTTKDLTSYHPADLHQTLTKFNTQKRLASRKPTLNDVNAWVRGAKRLACVSVASAPLRGKKFTRAVQLSRKTKP